MTVTGSKCKNVDVRPHECWREAGKSRKPVDSLWLLSPPTEATRNPCHQILSEEIHEYPPATNSALINLGRLTLKMFVVTRTEHKGNSRKGRVAILASSWLAAVCSIVVLYSEESVSPLTPRYALSLSVSEWKPFPQGYTSSLLAFLHVISKSLCQDHHTTIYQEELVLRPTGTPPPVLKQSLPPCFKEFWPPNGHNTQSFSKF